jgi:hypothetical protein
MNISTDHCYIYEGNEVKTTGRTAKRVTQGKPSRRDSTRTNDRVEILYEISPIGVGVASWKRWVRYQDLFEIVED